jgi:purine-binding chemotaxis protein CheW
VAALDAGASLLCRVGTLRCTLPLAHVAETMRPLPIEPLANTPGFVLGLSLVRGAPVPVIDAAALFGEPSGEPERLVIVRAGSRHIGLAVDAVLGVRTIDAAVLQGLPRVAGTPAGKAISAVGALDGELLVVLEAARIVPEDVLAAIDAQVTAA